MAHPAETFRITWQGIGIEISYCQQWLSGDIGGCNIAHLEIKAIEPERARLPMNETGYRSHFCPHENIMAYGGAKAFVIAWLENDAKLREWQVYLEKSRQADLFEL